ncbi:hypothetical protein [Methanothermococcus thermolithotrophicus]|uniref:hypothetical protein n=1 Tax=Methanothermococcus thermolithotrophicus TaxID=2186 RepID=UPI00036BE86F|nr:hypothetical protein [Methanothermococcus thermolithotrophicus]
MSLFGLIKRNNRENQNIQSMQLTADFEIKYKSLLEDISLLTNDLKKEFEKHAYYLAMNKLLYGAGVDKAEMFIDYHAGRVLELERILTRLYRIFGDNPNQLLEIVKLQKQRALEDIQNTDNLLKLLDQDTELEKIRGIATKNDNTNSESKRNLKK